MHTLTYFPLGNADSCRIDLIGGECLLFDYANVHDPSDKAEKRIDLPAALRKHLAEKKRDGYDVVAFTHLDRDHVCGARDFFELRHAEKYKGNGRVKIAEMWVPASAIFESKTELCEDAKVIQAEARYRLEKGEGIRVFSRPAALEEWLKGKGLTLESRKALLSDAGTLVPGWTKAGQGVEFFVHSPFANRHDDGTLTDRNNCSLVFQAVFSWNGVDTAALLMADSEYGVLTEIVTITKKHGRKDRLKWDLAKLPHHCSYTTLGPEKGRDQTVPVDEVDWLFDEQGADHATVVSTSCPIPSDDSDNQPPHRQAANYYKSLLRRKGGEFKVTMEHPTVSEPAPLVITIDDRGVTIKKPDRAAGAVAALGMPAPRAG